MTEEVRFQLRHPEASKAAPRISQSKYDLVKVAIVELVGEDGFGVPFAELADRVAATLPVQDLATLGSVGWYTTAVKLDLEARGLIERVPRARPQRLRRRT